MINGQFGQWIDEAQQHWQHALAALSAFRMALPVQEWIRIGAVALVTAVVTSQVTLAEIKGELKSLRSEREILVNKRTEQIAEIKRDIDELQHRQMDVRERLMVLEARGK